MSPLLSRAHMSRRDGKRAAEALLPNENMHVHQQDSSHGLLQILPGSSGLRCLLWRHQEQKEEGVFPLHWRHLVLWGDGNRSGMWMLQVSVVTAPEPYCLFCNSHRCHFVNSTHQRGCHSWDVSTVMNIIIMWSFFPHIIQFGEKEKTQTKTGHVCVFLTERKYIVRYKWEKNIELIFIMDFLLRDD